LFGKAAAGERRFRGIAGLVWEVRGVVVAVHVVVDESERRKKIF